MPEYKETADDLNKKYHGTFVLYGGQLAYMSHFTESGSNYPGEIVSATISYGNEKVSSRIEPIDPQKIESIEVNTKFINNDNFERGSEIIPAVLVSRKPKRQWRRGLCNDNLSAVCPVTNLYAASGRPMPPWAGGLDWKLVKHILSCKYPPFTQACALVDKYVAVAVSPMFCLCLSNISTDKYLLASPFGFIGECTKDTILVRHFAALQEVQDFVHRTQQSIHVEAVNA